MKFKKLIALAISFVTLAATVQPCFAGTVAEHASYIPDEFELELGVKVLARRSGEGEYTAALPLTGHSAVGVDYKSTLDMSAVRNFFDKSLISTVIPGDEAALEEFYAAKVTTNVEVVIAYPQTAIISGSLRTKGSLDNNNNEIFIEEKREVSGNKVTITYSNRDNLTVGELTEHKDVYLQDITFTLEDTVSYSKEGNHQVFVTMSGATKIDFASKKQTVEYYGGSSHITTYAEEIVNHVLEVVPLVPPTCNKNGSTAGTRCITHIDMDGGYGCGAHGIVKPLPIAKLDHPLDMRVFIAKVHPTCAKLGVDEHWMCTLCQQDFDIYGNKITHAALLLPVTDDHIGPYKTLDARPADCFKEGLSEGQQCEHCNRITIPQVVIPSGHNIVDLDAVAATCTTPGKTAGKKCDICGLVLVAQKIIPATGHKWGAWETTLHPTEQAEGSKKRVCQNDPSHVEIVSIPKLEHACSINPDLTEITKEPTCDKKGEKQEYCSCGKPVGKPKDIPALGHNLQHISAVAATCTEEGIIEHYECSNCGKMYRDANAKKEINSAKQPIDKSNHAGHEVVVPGMNPTCTEKGLTDGMKCSKCDRVTVKQKVLPTIWNETIEKIDEIPAGCEKPGIKEHYHCQVCNNNYDMKKDPVALKDLEIPALIHNLGPWETTKEPTTEEKGERRRVCERNCGYFEITEISKLEHEHNEIADEIIKEATCTETGLMSKVYSCCGEPVEGQQNIVVPKKDHNLVLVKKVEPSCHSNGVVAHYKCTECGKKFHSKDMTTEIDNPETLDKRVHHFEKHPTPTPEYPYGYNECKHCHERVIIEKPDNVDVKVEVDKHGGIKEEKDLIHEKKDTVKKVESKIIIEPREEVSEKIDQKIEEVKPTETATVEKVAYDIDIEKITTYYEVDGNEAEKDLEKIFVTADLVTIIIEIPENMRHLVDFIVHRHHIGEDGKDSVDEIRTEAFKNADGEYIEIDTTNWNITLHVKKFSEYAVVGYSEPVNIPEDTSGSGGGLPTYTITFNTNGGIVLNPIKVTRGSTLTLPTPVRDGYIFAGWFTDPTLETAFAKDSKVTSNLTLYAKWTTSGAPTASTDIGGDKSDIPVDNVGGKHMVDVDALGIPEKDGFAFTGWYTEPALINEVSGTIEITEDTIFYPGYLNLTAPANLISDEHVAYIHGYPDGEVKPNGNITREEVVAALSRLLKPEYSATIATTEHNFPDVNEGRWSEEAIATMANGGYVVGDENGNFNPSKPITRAEFVTITVKFMNQVEVPKANYFSDIQGHWAEESIKKAAHSFYWILGYEDGTFKPNNYITRAEAMTIINKMLVRYGDHTSEHAAVWPDVSENDWFYSNVIEATTHNHIFDRHDNGWSETWTGISE